MKSNHLNDSVDICDVGQMVTTENVPSFMTIYPKGKWEILPKSKSDPSPYLHIRCTNCGAEPFGDIPHMFCPNCGAKMFDFHSSIKVLDKCF